MKKLFFIILIFTLALACKKEEKDNACNSDNPIEDFIWLKELKATIPENCVCETSLIQGSYENQTVYYIAPTDLLCDGIIAPTLYDCNGDIVRIFTPEESHLFFESVTQTQVLYTCKKTPI